MDEFAVMCEPSSSAEVVHVDVAEKEAATVEYWQTALQELCKNQPHQHAYVANPLAAPQAYGLLPPVRVRVKKRSPRGVV